MLKVTTLPSGLRVATYKIDRQAAALVVTVGVGRRYEAEPEKGISHFVEHVLNNGTTSYPNPRELRESVEVVGGSKGAATSDEKTVYNVTILNEHLDQALKTAAEMIQDSVFDPVQTQGEKETLKSEVHRLNDDSGRFVGRLITEALWPGQPLASRKDLEEQNFETLSLPEVKKHFDTYYTAPNMVVTVAGNVDHETWVEKIEKSFSKLPVKPAPSFTPAVYKPGISLRTEVRDLKETKFDLAFYGPSRRDNDRFAVGILRSILGKSLFYKLREELRLSYNPYSDMAIFEDTGCLEFGGSFKVGKIRELAKAIMSEIDTFKNGGFEESELEFARARIKSNIILKNESVFALAGSYSNRVFHNNEPLLLEDEIATIEKLTKDDIIRVANKYLDDNFKIAAIGPANDIETLENLYGQKKSI